MIYRISLITNVSLSLVFIILGVIGTFFSGPIEMASVLIMILLLFAYGIFLIFNLVCYRTLAFNKERLPISGWIKDYRKTIFVMSILALACVLFMTVAAAYAFFSFMEEFPGNQRPFFIAFLALLLVSAATYIMNAVGYTRSVKENQQILNASIDEIGSISANA